MPWQPENPPAVDNVQDAVQWVFDQFQQLAKDRAETLALELRPSAVEPERPREGMIVYADGTNWDPGQGEGPYVYNGTEWLLLSAPSSGTFTPTLTTDGVNFTSVTYDNVRDGRYVLFGNVVMFWITIRTDAVTVGSATGAVVIGGLPFAAALSASQFFPITVGYAANWAGEEPLHALVQGTTSFVRLYYRTAVDGNNSPTAVADVGTGANNNEIYLTGMYLTT